MSVEVARASHEEWTTGGGSGRCDRPLTPAEAPQLPSLDLGIMFYPTEPPGLPWWLRQ